ncbi:Zn-ribbon domain-containing OB-fold protein [Sphingobium sp. EM0848]|uniref:Zn-ribbon domain-containing OB-fold protein n=1 Tax=Sphingobium sp. EM0848 TaxID=2743473 RepID=UPI00159CAE05|nr:zinc ribbon domain-containing protein [Sphingobium sp. EM0848]
MSETIDQPFWDGLSKGQLRIQRCATCGQWTWPPQERCGPCGSWDMGWEAIAMEGIVHSFTWVRHPFTPAMSGRTPFANLLVELPQAGGARLLGLLEGAGEGLAIGAAVTAEVIRDTDDHLALRWRLKP